MKNDHHVEELFKPNHKLMQHMNKTPDDWKFEHDEELAQYLSKNLNIDTPGSVRNIIKMISFASQRV